MFRVLFALIFLLNCSPSQAVKQVDIGVFYTHSVLKYISLHDLHALLIKRTKLANQILQQSGVKLRRNVVAFERVQFEHKPDTQLRDIVTKASESMQLRNNVRRFGLDYVTVIVDVPGIDGCGAGEVGRVFSVMRISDKCNSPVRDFVLAHEWGHLDGITHDKGVVRKGRGSIMSVHTQSNRKQLTYSADSAAVITKRMKLADAVHNTHLPMTVLGEVKLVLVKQRYSEKDKVIKLKIELSKRLNKAASVQLFSKNITTSGTDVKPVMTRLIIPAGVIEVYRDLPILDDNRQEPPETLLIGIRYPERLKVVSYDVVRTIVSDD